MKIKTKRTQTQNIEKMTFSCRNNTQLLTCHRVSAAFCSLAWYETKVFVDLHVI